MKTSIETIQFHGIDAVRLNGPQGTTGCSLLEKDAEQSDQNRSNHCSRQQPQQDQIFC